MKKASTPVSKMVTATTWLDTHLVHAYLKNKYQHNPNILVIPTTNPKSFEDFYLGTYAEIDHKLRDTLTDIIIPFHMEPSMHFTLMHVKLVGDRKQPVIYWLDSLGNPMPESVRNRVNHVFQQPDKVVHEQPIKSQQKDGYDCGVYVALNAESLVQNNTNEFKTMTAEQSVALRKEMVAVANADFTEKYVFVESPTPVTASKVSDKAPAVTVDAVKAPEVTAPTEDWNQDKFVNTVSQDLLQFGEMIQDSDNAFDEFDRAFDIAAAAYQNATKSLTSNRYAFFSEYQNLKAQFTEYQSAKTSQKKSCAAEVEPVVEAGKDLEPVLVK